MKYIDLRKIIMRLNLILALLTFCLVNIYASGMAQKVTLNTSNAELKEVFLSIREQTSFNFLYSNKQLKKARPVTVQVNNMDLKDALEKCFQDQPITFSLMGNNIIIKDRPEERSNPTKEQDKITVSGTVRLDGSGETIPGVSIRSKDGLISASTNSAGQFNVIVNKGSTLIFSLIGHQTQERVVNTAQTLDILLKETLSELDEVVVTGYIAQERRSITGAMSSIGKEAFENVPVQSFDRALQGRVSGVNIMAANGVPGGEVNINIRGMGSISAGNSPLIIVDGVQLSSTSSGQTASNPLSFLNNNDIESVEVLKDGAAASIYGAQAANGVILVTTKSGKAGKTQFNINYYNGITEPMPEVEMMNSQEFIAARIEARNNKYPNRDPEVNREYILNRLKLNGLSDAEINALPTYNWQEAAFRSGKTNNVDFSTSGGNEKTTFFISGSFNKTEGNIVGIDFQRGTGKINLKHKATEKLKFDLNTNFSSVVQNGSSGSSGSTGNYAAPQYSAPTMLPFIPIYLEDGSHNAPIEGFPGSSNRNPIYETLVHTLQSRSKSLVGNFSASYDIIPGLTFKSFYGGNLKFVDDERYVDPRTRSGASDQGSLYIGNRNSVNFLTNQTLNFRKTVQENHKINMLLGVEYRSYKSDRSSVTGKGFTTHQFRTLRAASIISEANSSWSGFKRFGVFGQANYDYKGKYFGSAVLRYDGSSRFGINNLYGWFPAISAGWNLEKEDFLRDQSWLNELKIRAGYGETGNDAIGNFDARSLYTSSSSTNYNQQPGMRPDGIANVDLRWERNATTNIGLDYRLLNKRIWGSFDVFQRISKDLLLDRPLPYTGGFSTISSNVGKIKNEGIELEIGIDAIRGKAFSWTSNFNISFLRNEVLALLDDEKVLPGDNSIRVGYPMRTNYTYEYGGVNSATGRPFWYDKDGEVIYDPTSRKVFGNELSDFYGGFTNTFSYKGFSLDVFFHFDYGRELDNSGMHSRWYRNGYDDRNTLKRVYQDRWQMPGQLTSIPRAYDGGAEVNSRSPVSASSRFLEDASFIRLKNVSLSYDLPPSLLKKVKLNQVRLYSQAVNLVTWTKWKGYDPELIINSGSYSSTQGTIPQTRAYTFGIQVGF